MFCLSVETWLREREEAGLSGIAILIDFGSTYTKAVAIDLSAQTIVGQGRAASTVTTDVTIGLDLALRGMGPQSQSWIDSAEVMLACSSAAGGLRLVAVGLTPNLSLEAGRLAALGAGAKLVGAYSYKLSRSEVSRMEKLEPDIVLLVGGTDGGNEEVILHNAKVIAASKVTAPIIVAGNKVCADEVAEVLGGDGERYVQVVDNVLAALDRLNVEASREAIREVFLERIVHAKGIDRATQLIGKVIMPTPMAVLRGAELLSKGVAQKQGLGDLLVVDIGGATTDVHSLGYGHPQQRGVGRKGLPEPFAKRTVEGDLGLRHNSLSILEVAGEERLRRNGLRTPPAELLGKICHLNEHPEVVPSEEDDVWLDIALARTATELAVERHAGRLEEIYSFHGTTMLQTGKDLTEVKTVIGTGGIFAHCNEPVKILEGALYSEQAPLSLRPKAPRFLVDREYILYAVGLLSEHSPEAALVFGKRYLSGWS